MLRRKLALVPWFALVLGAVAPSPAEAQKKPAAALGKVDGRAKLDALIASVLKKQDQQATALGAALAKSAQDLEGPAKKALAKAGIDVTQAQLDLEAAQKELDAAVRAKRLSEVSDKHKTALAAAMGATKSLVAPALAKLAPAASNAGALPSDGWVYLGTPPSAAGKPYTYESVSAPLPAPGLIVHTRRDVSELGIYVVSSYAGDAAPFGGFVQSFTVPAGVKAFDVADRSSVRAEEAKRRNGKRDKDQGASSPEGAEPPTTTIPPRETTATAPLPYRATDDNYKSRRGSPRRFDERSDRRDVKTARRRPVKVVVADR